MPPFSFFFLQVRNTRSKVRDVQQSRFAEASLHDMMDEDADMDYTVSNAHAWGGLPKDDSLTHEQDNVSSSTTVPGMSMGYDLGHVQNNSDNNQDDTMIVTAGGGAVHGDCASAAVSQ